MQTCVPLPAWLWRGWLPARARFTQALAFTGAPGPGHTHPAAPSPPQGIRRARKMAARGAAHSQVQASELSTLPSSLQTLLAAQQQRLAASQQQ